MKMEVPMLVPESIAVLCCRSAQRSQSPICVKATAKLQPQLIRSSFSVGCLLPLLTFSPLRSRCPKSSVMEADIEDSKSNVGALLNFHGKCFASIGCDDNL